MNTNALRLGVSGQSGFRFDSVSVHARSLDAAKSTTYAYNTSNQLTSSMTDGTTTWLNSPDVVWDYIDLGAFCV